MESSPCCEKYFFLSMTVSLQFFQFSEFVLEHLWREKISSSTSIYFTRGHIYVYLLLSLIQTQNWIHQGKNESDENVSKCNLMPETAVESKYWPNFKRTEFYSLHCRFVVLAHFKSTGTRTTNFDGSNKTPNCDLSFDDHTI